jgi:hypothetical protein
MEKPEMNGRVRDMKTPEERLAAVARSLAIQMQDKLLDAEKLKDVPDYADFRDKLRPYVRRELILARIDEARKLGAITLTTRMKELALELAECEMQIPSENRL